VNRLRTVDPREARFRTFVDAGGKFRVAIVNHCNLDCFFCHNEAMANPRRPADGAPPGPIPPALDDASLLGIINAYTRLGGRQVNLTGGEPLAHPDLPGFLARIEKRAARVVLNTNALLARRLLGRPRLPALDGILASLHTTDDEVFRAELGGGSARAAVEGIVALRRHGYPVSVN
jgi:molybdenum cofactor biosynthesis enzyme MoaA